MSQKSNTSTLIEKTVISDSIPSFASYSTKRREDSHRDRLYTDISQIDMTNVYYNEWNYTYKLSNVDNENEKGERTIETVIKQPHLAFAHKKYSDSEESPLKRKFQDNSSNSFNKRRQPEKEIIEETSSVD